MFISLTMSRYACPLCLSFFSVTNPPRNVLINFLIFLKGPPPGSIPVMQMSQPPPNMGQPLLVSPLLPCRKHQPTIVSYFDQPVDYIKPVIFSIVIICLDVPWHLPQEPVLLNLLFGLNVLSHRACHKSISVLVRRKI